jgi:hypothetical protein
MVLLIHQMQQHIIETHILTDATLEVEHNKQCVLWPGVASSSNNEEPEWCDVPIEGVDLT